MRFDSFLKQANFILSEGSVYERLRRHPSIEFDPYLAHATLIYNPTTAKILEQVHREYLDVGQRHNLPMLLLADTWRANKERIALSAFRDYHVNQDNIDFVHKIRASYPAMKLPIFVGGQMGPRGDAYKPEQALTKEQAESFHAAQVRAMAETNVDFILAATLPAFSEAFGIAKSVAKTELPYMLSFVIRPDGDILDGTPLAQAMTEIDAQVSRPPLGYYVNCVHPTVLEQALSKTQMHHRIIGFQANTSAKSPEELAQATDLETAEPEPFGKMMIDLHRQFKLQIIGGCCGTDTRHIESIANTYAHD